MAGPVDKCIEDIIVFTLVSRFDISLVRRFTASKIDPIGLCSSVRADRISITCDHPQTVDSFVQSAMPKPTLISEWCHYYHKEYNRG